MWKQDRCMCGWVRWGTVVPHIQGHLLGVTFSCSHHGLPAKDAPKQARRPAYCTPSASAWGLQSPPGLPVFRTPISDGNTSHSQAPELLHLHPAQALSTSPSSLWVPLCLPPVRRLSWGPGTPFLSCPLSVPLLPVPT